MKIETNNTYEVYDVHMAREKHDKKARGLIESMDINYSVIWAIKQKPSMTFCPLYVLLRGRKKK